MEKKEENRASGQARAQLDSIILMMERLNHCYVCNGDEDCELTDRELIEGIDEYYKEGRVLSEEERQEYLGKYHDEDGAREGAEENPLSIEVRSDWHIPGRGSESTEYRILLCTGGPAVQITGDLNECNKPDSAKLEYQDWFTPWEEYHEITEEEGDLLLNYARIFYFGE